MVIGKSDLFPYRYLIQFYAIHMDVDNLICLLVQHLPIPDGLLDDNLDSLISFWLVHIIPISYTDQSFTVYLHKLLRPWLARLYCSIGSHHHPG
jgi:hypothetical protein